MSLFSSKVKQQAVTAVQCNVLGGAASIDLATQALNVQRRYQLSNEELREYYEAFAMLCDKEKDYISPESISTFYEESDIDLSLQDCCRALQLFSDSSSVSAISFELFVDRLRMLMSDEGAANDTMRLAFRIFGDEEAPIAEDDVKSLLYCVGSPRLSKEEVVSLTEAAKSL